MLEHFKNKGLINGGLEFKPSVLIVVSPDSILDIINEMKSKYEYDDLDIVTDIGLMIESQIKDGSINILNNRTLIDLYVLYDYYEKIKEPNSFDLNFKQYLVESIDTKSFFNNPFNKIIYAN